MFLLFFAGFFSPHKRCFCWCSDSKASENLVKSQSPFAVEGLDPTMGCKHNTLYTCNWSWGLYDKKMFCPCNEYSNSKYSERQTPVGVFLAGLFVHL